jgi:integrase/recombinase XerD
MDICYMKNQATAYMAYLEQEERSAVTCRQYCRDILCFLSWTDGRNISKETVIHYKEKLQKEYKPASVNAKLAALNGFFHYLDRNDLKVRQLKIQRQPYCSRDKELTREEYRRLITAAGVQKDERLSLLLQTICGTGIRVSELPFITAEAVQEGEATIHLKGKIRTILIPKKLRRLLLRYLHHEKRTEGPVFVTRSGMPLHRSSVWKMMKALCSSAHVPPEKVFPHNLRHLFARCFYGIQKDIARLADILGHSSIDTTRLYIVTTADEHRRQMDATGLVAG